MMILIPILVFIGYFGLLFGIELLSYVLQGVAIVKLSKKMGDPCSWQAFLPVFAEYRCGKLAEKACLLYGGRIRGYLRHYASFYCGFVASRSGDIGLCFGGNRYGIGRRRGCGVWRSAPSRGSLFIHDPDRRVLALFLDNAHAYLCTAFLGLFCFI